MKVVCFGSALNVGLFVLRVLFLEQSQPDRWHDCDLPFDLNCCTYRVTIH